MEFLFVVVGLFVAWRIYLAFLKKRAYGALNELADTQSVEDSRKQLSELLEILAEDLHHPGRLSVADGLTAFDMAVFLQDRIEHEDGSWPKTASAETNRKDVGRRLRANLAAEVDNRKSRSSEGSTAPSEARRIEVAPKIEPAARVPEAIGSTTSSFFPFVLSATRLGVKQIPGYRFFHYRDVAVKGGTTFPQALIVYKDQEMRLVVTSEINSLAQPGSGRSHFLCTWTAAGHENFGASDRWADAEEFSNEAISMAVRSVVMPDQLK